MAAFPKAPFSPFAMCLSPRPVNGFGDPAAPAPCIAVHFHRDPLQPFSLVKGCLQLVNQPFTHRQMFTGELSKHPGAWLTACMVQGASGTEAEVGLQPECVRSQGTTARCHPAG